jgi:peptidoglycan/xylan/chitin deacetylase (PgdA/CDA1 family)
MPDNLLSHNELIRALQQVPAIPAAIQRRFPQIFWEGSSERREIALTFDDGPDRRDTLALLEVLARE